MIAFLIFLQLENLELETPIEESTYLSQLEELALHPINPNQARISDWLKIPFLSPVSAYRLVENRGQYRSLDDLARAGIDPTMINFLRPFIRIGKPYRVKRFRSRIRYQLKDFDSLDNHRLYSRTIANLEAVKTFLVTERDPFEKSYLDYLGYGLLLDRNDLKAAVGRYNLEVGEGLIFGPEPFDFLRDYDFQSPRRGIIPYTQVSENQGFYGLALSYKDFYTFLSHYYLDGSVSNDTVRGIDYTGIHNDSASIGDKDLIREDLVGFGGQFGFRNNLIGLKGYHLRYDPPIRPRDSLPFYDDVLTMIGLDLRRYGRYGEVFGEVGLSNQVLGGLGGFVARLPFIVLTGAWCYYPSDFYSPHGGIVETGKNIIISNLELSKEKLHIGLRGYYQTRFSDQEEYYDLRPYLKNRFGRFAIDVELRQRIGAIPSYERGSSFKINYHLRWFRIGTRFIERYYPDSGPNLYGGAFSTVTIHRFRITAGLGSYSCPDGVVYVYEPDLPGRFNTIVLSGSGIQRFIIIGYKPIKGINLYLKYSEKNLGLQTDLTF